MQIDGMIGKKFGRLVVVGLVRQMAGKKRVLNLLRAKCECECGNTTTSDPSALRRGLIISCGCYSVQRSIASASHGCSRRGRKTPEYKTWVSMKARCLDDNSLAYKDYGGRGISICQRWIDSFDAFLSDMGTRPSSAHTIDRKNNDLGYFPENCRWATPKQQINNRRNTRFVVLDGVATPLTDACASLGLKFKTVSGRIDRGWAPERALTPSLWIRS